MAGSTVTLPHLDVPASQWRLQDITTAREVLKQIGADPDLARAWRGSVVLSFAEVEGSYPYLIPAIVGFLQKVYSEFPHLLYFLNPDPAKGALDSFCATIGALHEDQNGVWIIWSDDVATAFFEALADAAEFAINQGDDWVAVITGYQYGESQTRFAEIRKILIDRRVIGT